MKNIVLVALITASAILLITEIKNDSSIGHGDTANTAVVARNLASGKGYTVDYVWQFYTDYKNVNHEEDTWPLLEPTMVAVSYKIFGVNSFAAKLPNIIFLILTGLSVYLILYKLNHNFVSAVAGFILVILSPNLLDLSLLPFNDLAASLLLLWIVYFTANYITYPENRQKYLLIISVLSGILILQKPSALLFVAILLLLIAKSYGIKSIIRKEILPIFLIPLPYFVRNLMLFGTPLFTMESYHAYITKYRDFQEVFKIYYNNLPGLETLKSYGVVSIFKVIFENFRFAVDSIVTKSLLVHPILLGLAVLYIIRYGNLNKTRLQNELSKIFLLLFITSMFFFTAFWHFEIRYFVLFIPFIIIFSLQEIDFAKSGILSLLVVTLFVSIPGIKSHINYLSPRQISKREISSAWVKQNTRPTDIIMTQDPWELSFYSERKSVMIPFEDLSKTLDIARKYNAGFLQLDYPFCYKRPQFVNLCQGIADTRFSKLYDDGEIMVYKINNEKL